MSWEQKKIGEICVVRRGTSITQKQAKIGLVPVIAGGLKPAYFHNQANRLSPTISISGSGANAGYVNLWPEPIFASDCSTVEVTSRNISLLFVYYFLKSRQDYIYAKLRSGAAQPHVYAKDIAELLIPLPPLATQEKLVTKLDAIFAEINKATAAAEANIKNAEALFQSYLTEVFERGGDEWSTTNLQCVVKEVITGPFGSSLHKSDYVENGVPVINPQNIINGKIIPLNKTMVSIETKERLKKFALQKKDIVIARRGEMGRCGLVDTGSEGWLCGTGSMIIRLNDKANENYIFQLLQSNRVKQQLESASIGATMNNLNQSILLGVQIALPPIEFQVKILNTIEQLSKKYFDISQIYFKKIKYLTALKQSILQQAFNGELIKE